MNERNGLAAVASADNNVAEDLANEDFFFEGEDGQLVGKGDDGDEQPSADDVAEGTEPKTQEELGDEGEEETVEGEVTAAPPPAGTPAAAPAAVAPAPVPPTPAPPQAPASEPEQTQRTPAFHEMVRANFPAALDHVVAQGAFRLSPEEAEVIDEAAAPVIERYGARVYLQTMSSVSQLLHNTLPAVVKSLMTVDKEAEDHEARFFTDYGFDRKTHTAEITKIAQYVKANNPRIAGQAYRDEIARVGYAMLNVTPPVKPAAPAPKAAAPGTPAKPGTKVIAKKAFAPASRGGGSAPPGKNTGKPVVKPEAVFDLNAMLRSDVDME